jgi:hypothetical protein
MSISRGKEEKSELSHEGGFLKKWLDKGKKWLYDDEDIKDF